jgi:parvulin-like peptidyl-prolyl isomerase
MKRQVVILMAAALALGIMSRAADIIDGVVAIVNDKVITYSEVATLVRPVERELRRSFSGAELDEQTRKAQMDALNNLIDRALIVQEFDAKGRKIPATVVEEHINDIIANDYGGNRAAFVKTLEAENLTLSQFRDQERERVIVQAMRNFKVQQTVIVSPYKIQKYYQDNIDQFKQGDQIKLRMIFIKRGEPVSTAVIAPEPTASTSTNETSSTNSEVVVTNAPEILVTNGVAATSGSETNALTLAKEPAALASPALGLPLPVATPSNNVEVTAVTSNTAEIAATNGSAVASVSETNVPAAAQAVAAPAAPAVDLQRKLAEEILAKLDGGDSFESMARVYSEGKEAKEGGDWGWVGRDILRKELNEIAFSLKPGQHSRLIDTAEGYYIVQVDDAKPAHTTPLAEVRDEIEKNLLQEQRTKLQEDWVKDLRARAYIRLF